jgi:hypothetical protein
MKLWFILTIFFHSYSKYSSMNSKFIWSNIQKFGQNKTNVIFIYILEIIVKLTCWASVTTTLVPLRTNHSIVVTDTLTKSLQAPDLESHRSVMMVTLTSK